ncbi:MAG: 50S ribosome-binding GTPase [Bdellovibrio sp.]|nr:50S ribosome-binding GTPase [Bdellovibrio sp.]
MAISNSSQNDIIIGCSSGSIANSAISVVRISGFFSLEKFQTIFFRPLSNVAPRKMYLSRIIDNGIILDDLLFCFFQSPNSYSGEDILELYPHGNVLNVRRIISAFIKNFGLRQAGPGEFTFRALNNKKLSFSQVEGLELLLNANSHFAFNQGLQILNGDLFRSYRKLYDEFIAIKSALNLLIDFSEDVGELEAKSLLAISMRNFGVVISDLYHRASIQAPAARVPRILIFGPTNAGKSTFFNFILSENRSIVSSIAGTTRDFISENIEIDGDLFIFTDSAGVRDFAENVIEEEGIRRSQSLLRDSFFKILVLSALDIEAAFCESFDFDLLLVTHYELHSFSNTQLMAFSQRYECPILLIGPIQNGLGSIGPDQQISGPIEPALFNYKILGAVNLRDGSIGPDNSDLRRVFNELVISKYRSIVDKNPILVDRHKYVISAIYDRYISLPSLDGCTDLGILSNNIESLGIVVSELIGVVIPEDSLDLIFSKFCIGK